MTGEQATPNSPSKLDLARKVPLALDFDLRFTKRRLGEEVDEITATALRRTRSSIETATTAFLPLRVTITGPNSVSLT